MSVIIKQSTARTVLVGPVLDSTGAAKTDEVVANIKITKNGTVGAADGSATLTHDHAGKYRLAMASGDTDTLGVLEISLNSGTNDMPVTRFNVVPAPVFDSLVAGSDRLDTNVTHIGDIAQTGRDLGASVLLSPGTGTGQISLSSGAVTVGTNNDKTGYTASTVSDKTGYSLTATTGLGNQTANITGNLSGSVGSVASYGTLVADVAAAVWAIATSTLTAAGTIGKYILDYLDATVGSRSSHAASDVAALILVTPANKLTTDASGFVTYANAAPPTAAVIADAVWDEASTGHTDANKAGAQLWTDIDAIAVDVAGLDGAAMRGTDGANTTTPPTASAVASQVRTELTTELGRIDAAISTRQATVANLADAVTMASRFSTMIVLDGAVWDFTPEALAAAPSGSGLTAQQIRDAMKLAPSAGTPADGSVDKHLDTIEAATGALSGSGARTVTITVNDGTDPLESARVRVTKGALSYIQETDAVGQCAFNLDDGTWTVAITLAGYSYAGTTLVVNGDETATYSMTAAASANPDPDLVNVVVTCYDEVGTVEQSARIEVQLLAPPAGDTGHVLDSTPKAYLSDANGLVTMALWLNATYRWRRGTGRWVNFTPDADPYTIASHLGRDA